MGKGGAQIEHSSAPKLRGWTFEGLYIGYVKVVFVLKNILPQMVLTVFSQSQQVAVTMHRFSLL